MKKIIVVTLVLIFMLAGMVYAPVDGWDVTYYETTPVAGDCESSVVSPVTKKTFPYEIVGEKVRETSCKQYFCMTSYETNVERPFNNYEDVEYETIKYIDGSFDAICFNLPGFPKWYECDVDSNSKIHISSTGGETVTGGISNVNHKFLCGDFLENDRVHESWLQCGGELKSGGVLISEGTFFGKYYCDLNEWSEADKFMLTIPLETFYKFILQPADVADSEFFFSHKGKEHSIRLDSVVNYGPDEYTFWLSVNGKKEALIVKDGMGELILKNVEDSGSDLHLSGVYANGKLSGTFYFTQNQLELIDPVVTLKWTDENNVWHEETVVDGTTYNLKLKPGTTYALSAEDTTGESYYEFYKNGVDVTQPEKNINLVGEGYFVFRAHLDESLFKQIEFDVVVGDSEQQGAAEIRIVLGYTNINGNYVEQEVDLVADSVILDKSLMKSGTFHLSAASSKNVKSFLWELPSGVELAESSIEGLDKGGAFILTVMGTDDLPKIEPFNVGFTTSASTTIIDSDNDGISDDNDKCADVGEINKVYTDGKCIGCPVGDLPWRYNQCDGAVEAKDVSWIKDNKQTFWTNFVGEKFDKLTYFINNLASNWS